MQSYFHTELGYLLDLSVSAPPLLFLSLPPFLSQGHPRTFCVVLFSLFVDLRNLFAILARRKNVDKFMRSSLASSTCSSFISTSATSSSPRPWPRLIPLSVLLSTLRVVACFVLI